MDRNVECEREESGRRHLQVALRWGKSAHRHLRARARGNGGSDRINSGFRIAVAEALSNVAGNGANGTSSIEAK